MNAGRKKAGMLAAMLTAAALVVAGCASSDPEPNPLHSQDAAGNPAAADSPSTNGDGEAEVEGEEEDDVPRGPDGQPLIDEVMPEDDILAEGEEPSLDDIRSDSNRIYFDLFPGEIDIHPQVSDFYDDDQIAKLMPNALFFIDHGLSASGLRDIPFDFQDTPPVILSLAEEFLTDDGMELLEEYLYDHDQVYGAYVLFPFLTDTGTIEVDGDLYTIDTSEDWIINVSNVSSGAVYDNEAVVYYLIEVWMPLDDTGRYVAQNISVGLGMEFDESEGLWLVNSWEYDTSSLVLTEAR